MKKDCIENQWCVWRMFQQESFLFLARMGSLVNHIAKNAIMETSISKKEVECKNIY
jgi:hypothetical protein